MTYSPVMEEVMRQPRKDADALMVFVFGKGTSDGKLVAYKDTMSLYKMVNSMSTDLPKLFFFYLTPFIVPCTSMNITLSLPLETKVIRSIIPSDYEDVTMMDAFPDVEMWFMRARLHKGGGMQVDCSSCTQTYKLKKKKAHAMTI